MQAYKDASLVTPEHHHNQITMKLSTFSTLFLVTFSGIATAQNCAADTFPCDVLPCCQGICVDGVCPRLEEPDPDPCAETRSEGASAIRSAIKKVGEATWAGAYQGLQGLASWRYGKGFEKPRDER